LKKTKEKKKMKVGKMRFKPKTIGIAAITHYP